MKSMCCLCIQFTHENTSERTILHLVNNKILAIPLPGLVACTAKKASYAPEVYVRLCAYISFTARVCLHHNYRYFTANIYFDVLLLCIIHNCYLYCCCVSIIIVICICSPGVLIWLINLFLFLFLFASWHALVNIHIIILKIESLESVISLTGITFETYRLNSSVFMLKEIMQQNA